MTVQQLLHSGVVSDFTVVTIRRGLEHLVMGYRYQEEIEQSGDLTVREFLWKTHTGYNAVCIEVFSEEIRRD